MITYLNILTKCMLILAWSVHINDIIVTISIFLDDWFQHLVWYIVLPIFGWRLESSWMQWINLSKRLFSFIRLDKGWIRFLCIFSKSMFMLAWVVHINDIVMTISVLLNYWFLHLMRNIILLVFWSWLKTSWMNRIYLW